MKRGNATLHRPEWEGDEEAMQLAQALGVLCDAEFLRELIAVKSALDQWGGQYVVAAKRERFNGNGQPDPEGKEFLTIGYVHHYQHIADVLRGAIKEPAVEVGQLEWIDSDNGDEAPVKVGDDVPDEEVPEQPPEDEPVPEEAGVKS